MAINIILSTLVVVSRADNARTHDELSNERLVFKADPIRSDVASIIIVFDPKVFCDLLDDQISQSKFSSAVGSTTGNPQNPDCEILENTKDTDYEMLDTSDKMMNTFASATRAKKPKAVSSELLENIWRIYPETAKHTIRMITQLNRQDVNSKLSRNFGSNDEMLRYLRIKSFSFTDTFFVTKKAESSRGYTCMQIFVSDKGYVYVAAMKSVSEFPKYLKMFAKEVGSPEAIIADSH